MVELTELIMVKLSRILDCAPMEYGNGTVEWHGNGTVEWHGNGTGMVMLYGVLHAKMQKYGNDN